jgi:hypothetical protein
MLKTLRKSLPVMAGLSALILTACPGGTPPNTVTPGSGTDVASISGTVTKEDGSPANNATVVLIKKEGGTDSDSQIVRTGDNGLYSFTKVSAGNYRVAFVIQTEQERKDKTSIAYDPNGKSGQFFGAITTKNFDFDGSANKTFQVPSFNVGWTSQLTPNDASIDFDKDTTFSWNAPKTSGSTEYNILIKDSNDNPFYKSANGSNPSFSLNPSTAKGNQGTNTGKSFEKGKTYYYIVNSTFSNSGNSEPTIAYGNTANAKFTIK